MKQRLSLLVVLALLSGRCLADTGTVIRPSPLQAEPYSDAATLTQLGRGTAVRLLERQGGWYQVSSGQWRGWVRLASVKLEESSGAGGESGIGESLRFAQTGRSGARSTQATTGVRGLDKKALAEATPDRAALQQLDEFAVSEGEAAAQARRHGLRPES